MNRALWLSTSLLALFLLAPVLSAAALNDSIVAYHGFASAGDVDDYTGNGHTLTIGNSYYTGEGFNGGARASDGSAAEMLTYNSSERLAASSDETFSLWVYNNDTGVQNDTQFIFQQKSYGVAIAVDDGSSGTCAGTNVLTTYIGGSWLCSATVLPTGEWTHIALVTDGSRIILYQNGVATINESGSFDFNEAKEQAYFHQAATAGLQSFGGRIDEVGVWDRALTTVEVQLLVANNSKSFYPFPPPTTTPEWVAPTPDDNTSGGSQVMLNASCGGNSTYLWFSTDNPPATEVLTNSSTGNYTTSVLNYSVYYYIAACWNDTTGFSVNTTVRSWEYVYVPPPPSGISCAYFSNLTYTEEANFICTLAQATNKTFDCFGITENPDDGSVLDVMPRQEQISDYGATGGYRPVPENADTQYVKIVFSTKRLKADTLTTYDARCYSNDSEVSFAVNLTPTVPLFTEPLELTESAKDNTLTIVAAILCGLLILSVGILILKKVLP